MRKWQVWIDGTVEVFVVASECRVEAGVLIFTDSNGSVTQAFAPTGWLAVKLTEV